MRTVRSNCTRHQTGIAGPNESCARLAAGVGEDELQLALGVVDDEVFQEVDGCCVDVCDRREVDDNKLQRRTASRSRLLDRARLVLGQDLRSGRDVTLTCMHCTMQVEGDDLHCEPPAAAACWIARALYPARPITSEIQGQTAMRLIEVNIPVRAL